MQSYYPFPYTSYPIWKAQFTLLFHNYKGELVSCFSRVYHHEAKCKQPPPWIIGIKTVVYWMEFVAPPPFRKQHPLFIQNSKRKDVPRGVVASVLDSGIVVWEFGLVWLYGISTIVGYLIPNPLYTDILNIYDLVWFDGISIIVNCLIPNPLCIYISNIYDLVGFYGISTLVG